MESRVVPAAELTSEELERWEELCREQPHLRSPFYSPHYTQAVASVRPHVLVCVLRGAGGAAGFFPFQFRSTAHRLLGAAERVGEEMTDFCGLIAEPGLRLDPRQLLRQAGLNYYYFTHLHENQLVYGLEGEKPVLGLSIRFDLGEKGYWDYLSSADRKLTADTDRLERQAERDLGPLRFCLAEREWKAPLDHLLREKGKQYIRTGRKDVFAVAWRRRLVEALAESSAEGCTGVLSTLYAGETWLASHFGIRRGELLHYWFPVYNIDVKRYAPGRLLLKKLIREGPGAGILELDQGAGESFAKRKMSHGENGYQVYRGAWYRPGGRSALYRGLQSLQWRWELRQQGSRGGETS